MASQPDGVTGSVLCDMSKATAEIFATRHRAAHGVEPCPALRSHRHGLRYDRAPLTRSDLAACAFAQTSSFVWCHIKKARGFPRAGLVRRLRVELSSQTLLFLCEIPLYLFRNNPSSCQIRFQALTLSGVGHCISWHR